MSKGRWEVFEAEELALSGEWESGWKDPVREGSMKTGTRFRVFEEPERAEQESLGYGSTLEPRVIWSRCWGACVSQAAPLSCGYSDESGMQGTDHLLTWT